MILRVFYFLLILHFCSCSSAKRIFTDNPLPTTISEEKFKFLEIYTYTKKGQDSTQNILYQPYKLSERLYYNKKKNLVAKVIFKDRSVDSTAYVYDKNEKCVLEKVFLDGAFKQTRHKYFFNKDSLILSQYDSKEHLVELKKYNPKMKIIEYKSPIYNSKNIVSYDVLDRYSSDSFYKKDVLHSTSKYEYDDLDRLKIKYSYDKNEVLTSIIEYLYEDKHKTIINISNGDKRLFSSSIEYRFYNPSGSLIKAATYKPNTKETSIIEYKYYKK